MNGQDGKHPYISDEVAALAGKVLALHRPGLAGYCVECVVTPYPCPTARLFGVVR